MSSLERACKNSLLASTFRDGLAFKENTYSLVIQKKLPEAQLGGIETLVLME